jgi:hypothetical protein
MPRRFAVCARHDGHAQGIDDEEVRCPAYPKVLVHDRRGDRWRAIAQVPTGCPTRLSDKRSADREYPATADKKRRATRFQGPQVNQQQRFKRELEEDLIQQQRG